MNSNSLCCQFCGASIALADVNVSTDIALCRKCGKTMAFSDISPIPGAENIDLSQLPKGVRFEESIYGHSIVYREISPSVFFLIPFTCFWSGVSMFGIYSSQISKGHFELGLSLFGLPFLIGTVFLISLILFMLFGKWRIRFSGEEVSVAMLIGPFAWTRRLLCDRSATVRICNWRANDRDQEVIQVECQGKTLRFGSGIPKDANVFIAEALRRMIHGEGF